MTASCADRLRRDSTYVAVSVVVYVRILLGAQCSRNQLVKNVNAHNAYKVEYISNRFQGRTMFFIWICFCTCTKSAIAQCNPVIDGAIELSVCACAQRDSKVSLCTGTYVAFLETLDGLEKGNALAAPIVPLTSIGDDFYLLCTSSFASYR